MKHLLLSSALFSAILCVTPVKAKKEICVSDKGNSYEFNIKNTSYVRPVQKVEKTKYDFERREKIGTLGNGEKIVSPMYHLGGEYIPFKREENRICFYLHEEWKIDGKKSTHLNFSDVRTFEIKDLSFSQKVKVMLRDVDNLTFSEKLKLFLKNSNKS